VLKGHEAVVISGCLNFSSLPDDAEFEIENKNSVFEHMHEGKLNFAPTFKDSSNHSYFPDRILF
jgi:hypothetical protein